MDKSQWRNWGDHPIIVSITVLGTIVGIIAIVFPKLVTWQPSETNVSATPEKTPSYSWVLPQGLQLSSTEEQVPILDKNLYIGRYYSQLTFGGVNIAQVEIAFRSRVGDAIEVRWNNIYKRLEFPYESEPTIEIKYKDKYIEIEVVNESITSIVSVREMAEATMVLKEVNQYSNPK